MALKCNAKVLSSVPKLRAAVTYPTEKVCALEQLCPGMSYSAVDCELNVMNQQYIFKKVSLNRNRRKKMLLGIDWLTECYKQRLLGT